MSIENNLRRLSKVVVDSDRTFSIGLPEFNPIVEDVYEQEIVEYLEKCLKQNLPDGIHLSISRIVAMVCNALAFKSL